MKIAIIGATGYVGSKLLAEALERGHQVSALVQNIDKLPSHTSLTAVKANVNDEAALTAQLAGHDIVISAFSGHAAGDVYQYFVDGFTHILNSVKAAGVARFLVVGGAGSLEVAPGVQVVDTPSFPAEWKGTALGARTALELLRKESTLDWSMLSPSAHLEPGSRTGVFRLGGDQLLLDAQGESRISVEDYAVAMLNEAENAQHSRQRFTLGY
ncbi:NAD(P)-dependent oxidoreductase [Iodobacter fluviatilis]|uniref:3-beta hydroxysteroid dehydrogenase n=1 Tax=Iodobacter fluviatilis TaxID=537 RepID=A0A7G3GDN1_9NEIS|nr:NAD(P)-dependent oxidoreductase [Iodobacter fluviatilis]QBC45426.1 3-beta hydroxysteroid dehydrogenase [Iodobacter fluviatilis]